MQVNCDVLHNSQWQCCEYILLARSCNIFDITASKTYSPVIRYNVQTTILPLFRCSLTPYMCEQIVTTCWQHIRLGNIGISEKQISLCEAFYYCNRCIRFSVYVDDLRAWQPKLRDGTSSIESYTFKFHI